MDGILSVSELRDFAENMRDSIKDRDAKAMQDIGEALAKKIDAIPADAISLYSDATHYIMARGWGERATAPERGKAHVNMCPAGINEPEISFTADDETWKDEAEYWMPAVLGDMFALADEYKIDIVKLIARAQEQREG